MVTGYPKYLVNDQQNRKAVLYAGVAALFLELLFPREARALAPRYLSDKDLSGFPIIVVAQWEKAAFESHNQYRQHEDFGSVIITSEAYTKLRIVRTVKGAALTPGQHDLKVGWGITWSKDGTWLNSGTSTELPGDVPDVTSPCLWFLKRERSWDQAREAEHLSIDNYRQIQPLDLEEYFLALGSARPETEVPRLLTPEKPEVAFRVLRYISGGIWPWPYDPDRFEMMYTNPESRGRVLCKQAEGVWDVVDSQAEKIRPYAVSVYAHLKETDCVEDIRTLLSDTNSSVRGIAIGILLRHRDASSLSDIQEAIQGVDEGWLVCKLIEELSSWGDERLVPSLISQLQNNQFAYQYGDDLGIPALKSRQALMKITGHWFPLDVDRSMEAWRRASLLTDDANRRALLEKLIPGKEFPFLAELIGEPIFVETERSKTPAYQSSVRAGDSENGAVAERKVSAKVRIRNIMESSLIIAKLPSQVSMSWPAGSSYGGGLGVEQVEEEDFTTLRAGQSLDIIVDLDESFLLADPTTRALKISYRENGSDIGLNAWIGTLTVLGGPTWKEERLTSQIEETWPNGNLKAAGMTVNGKRFGEWNYFNEQGDRIKTVYYGEGRGTATCNPEHPSNKGAGKRPPGNRTPKPSTATE